VEALLERGDEIVVTPMRGERSDWYRNVLAGGLVQVRFRGKTFERIGWRELSEEERRDVLALYREEHPVFGRMIVWGMGRAHRDAGDRISAAAKAGPLLALTLR
jgi:deazaflavin-dependent oxidoreductase (nitroreductase family)